MVPDKITPVILCGGIGSRLWPRSRTNAPKPFLPLVGSETLFQEALRRCRDSGFEKPFIVTGADQLELVESQAEGFEVAAVIAEPQSRQTAAAVALAALRLPPERILLVCPSDHHMPDVGAFADACRSAAGLAADGMLACVAVRASAAETRFGYVRAGEPLGPRTFRVSEFVEKPDSATAEQYLASGDFAWNSGIFAFRAGDFMAELERHRPNLAAAAIEAVRRGSEQGSSFRPNFQAYDQIEPESVDCAVMENTDRAAMVLSDMDWSDLGDWRSLKRIREKDEHGNSIRGAAEVLRCRDILIDTDGPKVHVVGLDEVIIVVDGDDILVASANSASEIRRFTRRD